ncbi:sensor histidine kinase [Geodermatophilus ruber]|uniref:Anti-sigma regulatory factor (Ser/Thr protein kinase) n=1 Tax=Geodermatophilus ruber TaxID=504800 RepID=A0A1I4KPD3_9ACTN|nr:sensor histidine kinase [Geodermatophilus ruber]SFL80317.1 Anti-sigma regulatory factor (Ser/Thr protein kinase) [Geodermatophilus ruber]
MDRGAGEGAALAHDVLPGPPALRVHTAAIVDSDADLLAAAVPFVEEGLRAGDLTVLSCGPEAATLLAGAFGEALGGVERDARMALLDTRAPDALGVTRQLLARAAETRSGRLRVLGQVQFGSDPVSWREGQRYEAAVNALLDGCPLTAMCLYDSRVLPTAVVSSARLTHPQVVADGRWVDSPEYCDPRDFLRLLPVPREPVEDIPPVLAIDDAPTLAGLRHALAAALETRVPDRDQREDLHLAISEVAANAFRHGRRPVSARLWADGTRMVCTITDAGGTFGDPLAGFQPAHGDDLSRGGMGLWLARKLWDSVDLLPGAHGLTVRLCTRLH